MIIFEWKYNPLKTKMGFMATSGESGNSGNGGESGGGGESGSSSTSSTSSSNNSSNNSSQSTLGTNGYTPGGLNDGYSDSQGGKYGSADASKSNPSTQSPYTSKQTMSWTESVAADVAQNMQKGMSAQDAISQVANQYGLEYGGSGSDMLSKGLSVLGIDTGRNPTMGDVMQAGAKMGLFNSNTLGGVKGTLNEVVNGYKGLLTNGDMDMSGRQAGILGSMYGLNENFAPGAKGSDTVSGTSYNPADAAKQESANRGLNTPGTYDTPASPASPASPANTTNDSIGSVLGHNDYTPGTPSDNTSSGNKGIVGVTSGSSNNNSSVDNGSLASGGSGSLSGPTRNTDAIGFSKYNKDEANYDQDDWNRGMETQSSGLVSDEECKHFAKRAFADGPHFKKSRMIIIDRLR